MAEHGAAGGDDLTALFEGAPAAPVVAPVVPGLASGMPEISFDDDDETPEPSMNVASIDDLFADDPEVQAQRQIQAAQQEQSMRELGYTGVGRTASAGGAKKLGQVRSAGKVPVEKALENLWDRP